jgi:hypothetical protein
VPPGPHCSKEGSHYAGPADPIRTKVERALAFCEEVELKSEQEAAIDDFVCKRVLLPGACQAIEALGRVMHVRPLLPSLLAADLRLCGVCGKCCKCGRSLPPLSAAASAMAFLSSRLSIHLRASCKGASCELCQWGGSDRAQLDPCGNWTPASIVCTHCAAEI